MIEQLNTSHIPIGVVGLGLMGSSIVAALLISGHAVKAIAPIEADAFNAEERIQSQLILGLKAGLIEEDLAPYLKALTVSQDYGELADCKIVLECVIEDLAIKADVYHKITSVVGDDIVVGSNTSAIPISELQKYIKKPERFLGVHWAEPAFMTRFLEITCGTLTEAVYADRIFSLAGYWGKEPTLLKKDIRGFITNRLMYAVYREIFHQIEKGAATKEDLDKAFRYDAGSWMTLMGVFRRMDYQGLEDYQRILTQIFARLSNSTEVPALMQKMVERHARGVHNGDGLYEYEEGEAAAWDEAFASFNHDIHSLAAQYSAESVTKVVKNNLA